MAWEGLLRLSLVLGAEFYDSVCCYFERKSPYTKLPMSVWVPVNWPVFQNIWELVLSNPPFLSDKRTLNAMRWNENIEHWIWMGTTQENTVSEMLYLSLCGQVKSTPFQWEKSTSIKNLSNSSMSSFKQTDRNNKLVFSPQQCLAWVGALESSPSRIDKYRRVFRLGGHFLHRSLCTQRSSHASSTNFSSTAFRSP